MKFDLEMNVKQQPSILAFTGLIPGTDQMISQDAYLHKMDETRYISIQVLLQDEQIWILDIQRFAKHV